MQHVTFETLAECPDMRHKQADTGPDDRLIKINAPDSDISTAFASQQPPALITDLTNQRPLSMAVANERQSALTCTDR